MIECTISTRSSGQNCDGVGMMMLLMLQEDFLLSEGADCRESTVVWRSWALQGTSVDPDDAPSVGTANSLPPLGDGTSKSDSFAFLVSARLTMLYSPKMHSATPKVGCLVAGGGIRGGVLIECDIGKCGVDGGGLCAQ
jgi:hypothetical protein